ncbi:hypothetical protein EV126DRAFT_407311 [Verticillium dahliae]|nr:hypothetical protein EV126DRAFT_407311 [Verticillium dahliae]
MFFMAHVVVAGYLNAGVLLGWPTWPTCAKRLRHSGPGPQPVFHEGSPNPAQPTAMGLIKYQKKSGLPYGSYRRLLAHRMVRHCSRSSSRCCDARFQRL